jgi:hypothetical protein
MLSKSLGCYISSGASSTYVDGALKGVLNSVEAIVGVVVFWEVIVTEMPYL